MLQYLAWAPAGANEFAEGKLLKYFYYIIALVVFALDQLTKKIIVWNVELWEQVSVIGNFFLITHVLNRGAAFSMLQGASALFIAITTVVVIGIVWYMEKNKRTGSSLLLTGLGLVLGGAIGNFVDRLFLGHVVDFLQFNFGSYTFPIFNVADMGITFGVALILLDSLLDVRRAKAQSELNGESTPHDIQPGNEADEPAR